MSSIPLPFFSQGQRVDADLHLPEGGGPHPVVIACSGYQGLKVIHPERFARALTPLGYAVLAFDYRGFGYSEGERGRLVPQDWVEDLRSGVDRLCGVDGLDADRLGLIGWGLGGGVVVAEAAEDPRVRAVAALNAVSDGTRSTKAMHDQASWDSLLSRVEADRPRRAANGRSEITSPWDIVRLDLDTATDSYVGEELYKAPGFGAGVNLESADRLLRFSPQQVAHKIAPRPLLVAHGDRNELHYPQEAEALYANAAEPKELVFLEGRGHTEWMFDDDLTFRSVVAKLDAFFGDALAAKRGAAAA